MTIGELEPGLAEAGITVVEDRLRIAAVRLWLARAGPGAASYRAGNGVPFCGQTIPGRQATRAGGAINGVPRRRSWRAVPESWLAPAQAYPA
jgi:hypothetical protein